MEISPWSSLPPKAGRPSLRRLARLSEGADADVAGPWSRCALRLDVPVATADHLFDFAALQLAGFPGKAERDFARRLKARHARRSTALGGAAALPHADSPLAPRRLALYVRTAQPLAFSAPDAQRVRHFLFLVVPRPATALHSAELARLQQRLVTRNTLQALESGHVIAALEQLWLEAARA